MPRKSKINLEIFKKLFYEENKSAKEVADYFGLSVYTIRMYRYRRKLPKKYASGEKNTKWKGGKYLHGDGYLMIKIKTGEYMLEHRFIMSQNLKRPLFNHEIVHHKNGNKLDNRIENLCVHTRSSHAKEHFPIGSKFGINSRF